MAYIFQTGNNEVKLLTEYENVIQKVTLKVIEVFELYFRIS
jgi:hypothetical protein